MPQEKMATSMIKNTEMPLWQKKCEMALESLRQSGQTLSYADLAALAEIDAPQRIHKLTGWLENTMCADTNAGHPLRAALIISKYRGIPAPGFFIHAKALGLYDGPTTGALAAEFHSACLKKLTP